jgi:hypothetical protein
MVCLHNHFSGRRSFFALGLAAFALSAMAPPDEVRVLETKDCTSVPMDSEGIDMEEVCGFNGVAMNDAGDRLLTVTVAGRIQLWSREGEALAAFDTASMAGEQLLFAGDRALFLDGRGALVMLDGRTGAEIAHFGNMPIWAHLHRLVGPDLLYLTTFPPGGYVDREAMIISLADGAVRARRLTGPQPRYASGGWAAGVTMHKDKKGKWRGTLHRADPDLSEAPLERWCDPFGPIPTCIQRDLGGPYLHLFDPATRRWSRHDMGMSLTGETLVEWAQAGGRNFPVICARGPVLDGDIKWACRIVDLAGVRTLHAFEAAAFVVVGGLAPDGSPELRLASRAVGEPSTWTVSRMALDGGVRTVGRFGPASPFSVDGPAGLIWTSAPEAPGTMVAAGASGKPVARMDARFAVCAGRPHMLHPHSCLVSADSRHIAGLARDARILWGPILWLGPNPAATSAD